MREIAYDNLQKKNQQRQYPIRMDQEIIRTLDPQIICSACQKKKKPNEQYSFEAETSHFSAYINFEILHMKKLPNSLKYLQENDEIQEKLQKIFLKNISVPWLN